MKQTKTLHSIQVFAKIFKVLYMIGFIGCLVGFIGCIIGLAANALGHQELIKIGGVTVYGLIFDSTGLKTDAITIRIIVAMITLAIEMTICKKGADYFKHELKAGTPFTFDGAKELFRFGILNIVLACVESVVLGIVIAVFEDVTDKAFTMDFNGGLSVGFGLVIILFSLICKYGAEQAGDGTVAAETYETE